MFDISCYNLYLRVLAINLKLTLTISMYKSGRDNDPLIRVDEPLDVSVSVELGGGVAPRPDHRHWLGGQVGRAQWARQSNLLQTV